MAVQISGNDITVPRDGTFTRNVTIGGTLTYEDVTNIDSVGLITARNGIEIGARPGVAASISVDGNMIVSGISTFGGNIAGQTASFAQNIAIRLSSATNNLHVHQDDSDKSIAQFTNNTTGSASGDGFQIGLSSSEEALLNMKESSNMVFKTADTERLRIDSNGMIGFGGVTPKTQNTFDAIEFGKTGFLGSQTGARTVEMASNAYYNSGWKYKEADVASQYYQYQGYHAFTSAASGSADGAISFVERLRINSDGRVLIGDDTPENTIGLNARVQTFGTDASTSGVAIRRGSNDAQAAFLVMSKSRNTTVGSRTILQNGDEVGNIFFAADDGTDLVSNTAAIKSQVDGAPGANDTPGNLSFWTTSDGSNAATQKMIISNAGLMTVTKQYFLVVDLSSTISSYNATGSGVVIFNRIAQEYKDSSLASCFNTSNGLFTAPITGLYFLEASIYSTNASFGQSWFVVAGARKSYTDEVKSAAGAFVHNHSMLRLTAGETVGFLAYDGSGSNVNIQANANHTYMKISLIC